MSRRAKDLPFLLPPRVILVVAICVALPLGVIQLFIVIPGLSRRWSREIERSVGSTEAANVCLSIGNPRSSLHGPTRGAVPVRHAALGRDASCQACREGCGTHSWEARDGRSLYAFLWGTNRLKTKAEITSPACALTTTAEVMGIFSRFAAGEHVFWFWTAEECAECAYPSQETVDALVAHARVVGIKLELGARDFEVDVPEFVHEAECFQPGAPGHGG